MLEGAVARLLNQLLGKYVVDLDTENLNVGIFSGQVQLTDLKLKPDALYELNLPIEVKAGTIGKIWLQIPWTSLWCSPIVVNIEDLHMVVRPVVTKEPFDPEKNKRLTRAAKKKVLKDLEADGQFFGGPSIFIEHLVSNMLNFLQVTITNVHIRYEDTDSWKTPIAAGLCISNITAETTNSKWKPTRFDRQSETSYYLVKIEAFSIYWNCNATIKEWDLPSQYYQWRNAMSSSLQHYNINGDDFNFVLNPLITKIKMVITKSASGNVSKLHTDVIVQDCNIQVTKEQYDSMYAVADSMARMTVSWQFLEIRPKEKVSENQKIWWRYASYALLEQRVKPYTWSRIRRVRQHYKDYRETYKRILNNPNDTELKMDLQKYEDNLSIINIVIARQQACLMEEEQASTEKSFWSMLPSPEKKLICDRIGFLEDGENVKNTAIEHHYSFRLGNFNLTLLNNTKEILVLTLTQMIFSFKPSFEQDTFKCNLKIEGLVLEGATDEDHLISIISSEHLGDSPAYFFKMDLEKMPKTTPCRYKLALCMDSVEYIYNKPSIDELESFLNIEDYPKYRLLEKFYGAYEKLGSLVKQKLLEKWEMNLNIKIPYFIIPDVSSFLRAQYLLVVDLGRYSISTELCQQTYISENATQMELEEQLYSKLFINCTNVQLLFCDTSDNWKDARKEKDTDMHVVSKSAFSSIFALSVANLTTIPRYKFNVTFQTLKFNISERKIGLLLKFFNSDHIQINVIKETQPKLYDSDRVKGKWSIPYLRRTQSGISIVHTHTKYRRYKAENGKIRKNKKESVTRAHYGNMNEAWARCVDLPGLEDNISPSNTIDVLFGFVVTELSVLFSRSSDSTDRQYVMVRLGLFTMDIALMTYGPAYQMSINNILLTDKLHTTPSGQYLDLIHSPLPNNQDVLTVLYRRVSASCPEFWTHFHGVETSLVANLGTVNLLLHQEAVHTILKYSKYLSNKFGNQISPLLKTFLRNSWTLVCNTLHKKIDTPVPPGSVKFSHSARLGELNITVCDSDFDIVHVQLSGLELDFLFRANERFVFRSFLSNINVEHLSDVTLYSKVLYTDEGKVFDMKYVKNATNLNYNNDISPNVEETFVDGSFKFQLGKLNCTFLYKLIVQLQRFILNLEALPYIEKMFSIIYKTITAATQTLKDNTKVNLSIHLCGPVFLIPQKSSSPNVLVIDTGELTVENFFKEYSSEVTENILLKLNKVTISRGIMTLTSTLEMQETLIEPISLNMDIKKFTNCKTTVSSWDIDSIIESIQVTLGQRDLTTIMSIYTDNIGEGKILDLFPVQIKSPTDIQKADDTVKTLEAFFCEPKQKNVVAKCTIDEMKVMLFFDSGELLSSPIRDLNHGLCKLEVQEIDLSAVVYNDRSLDGKLSVNKVFIEEIGPDANAFDKTVLQSPSDDNKNNNCNITVNKPPIVDITFHQNKTGDRSADVIIGRLGLSLSIPFCEKLALFIIECLPKENMDDGIVNPGYEAEVYHTVPQRCYSTSFTLSVRINRPELTFLVETTSNKKRYFITKSEILLDFSRHSNRLNVVMSLSGLHTLFYDLGEYADKPYTILKQCDMELCKCFSEESGEKITLTVSSIYVKLCSEVFHSVNDVLNDIAEHFKVPEVEAPTTERKKWKETETNDLWEPKKLDEFVDMNEDDDSKSSQLHHIHEILLIPKLDIVVIFELEQTPLLLFKSTIELTIYDWTHMLNSTCEVSLQLNYFNETVQSWEPLVDPIVMDEREYKPWEVIIKVFQDKALPMSDSIEHKVKERSVKNKRASRSVTTTEDEDSGEDMMYLEPLNTINNGNNRRVKTSLSTFLDDSDSENEDGTMEKLAAAISDLFTGDWNENEDSDCEHSSDGEDEITEQQAADKPEKIEAHHILNKSYYVLIDAKETFNVTVTPRALKVLSDLVTQYSNKVISVKCNKKSVSLVNDIAPKSKVEFFEKVNEDPEENKLIRCKNYENEDSPPCSPGKGFQGELVDNYFEDRDGCTDEGAKEDFDITYDFETVSSLQFPSETTAQLYDKINKNFIRIHIPTFSPTQTNCSKRNFEKLIRIYSTNHNQIYYLAVKHCIEKYGRSIVVSSPLQIKNETCFAFSVLYEPSVLQQLNLEPVGDVTNPFESTMRIAVVEANETYNVPLFIAYHCRLFIQPAYAESHYVTDSPIWWKDLATELDNAHNFYCKPKDGSGMETFALRVILKRHIATKNSQVHSIPNYVIHLLPPLIIHNFLPYALEVVNVSLNQVTKVDPGEKSSVYSVDFSKDQKLLIRLKHNSTTWSGHLNFTHHLDEKIVTLNTESKEEGKNLAINVKAEKESCYNLFFYAPYWIVNKTGLPLQLKATASNNIYECLSDDIFLFTYKRHGKQTLNLRAYESNWSNEFGLECAGTTGLIVCKDVERKKKYLFFLNTRLSSMCPRLTKIVTILPSFLVNNNTDKSLRFMEHNEKTDLWTDLAPQQTIKFWPETNSMEMYVKYRDSKTISQPFYTAVHHRTVLRMDKGSALTVEVTGGVSDSFQISFNDYKPGDAPILVKNYCGDLFLKIQQQNLSPVTILRPYNSLLYTWDDVTKPRQLVWNVYNNKGSGFLVDINKEGFGEEKIRFHSVTPNTSQSQSSSGDDSDSSDSTQPNLNKKVHKDKIIIYWICYRDGIQKTLLLTQELRIYNRILKIVHEKCYLEGLVALSGVGLSIFTSEYDTKEHLYLSISDTPAIWEVNVGQKWKTLTLELASWIEDKYRLHYKKCQLKEYVHIDFEKMYMLKPFFAELRRTYHPALYFQFRRSSSHQYYNLKLQMVQIDNKQTGNIALHPLPLPNIKEVEPFAEVSLSKIDCKDATIYKYIKVKVSNLYLCVENDLVVKLSELVGRTKLYCEDTASSYVNDITSIHKSVIAKANVTKVSTKMIDFLALTSFGIQLYVVNRVQMSLGCNKMAFGKVLHYLFPYNISPYMPMEGVHTKVSSIEQEDMNESLDNVLESLLDQATSQFLQQYYSHVLGLQVLVNTFAIQPAIEVGAFESEKMAAIVLYGCRCLLGHVNMSPAAVEACVTDIFANQNIENIQRMRRHGSYHKSEILPKALTISSRNFSTGVPNALSQLIVKNQNGMHCDGEMFFRTTGKALLSLITRHPDEKSDSVEVAREALRRAWILGEPIKIHQRLTRYTNKYLGLRPLSVHESMGQHLLETICNSRFMNDTYWAHVATDKIGKTIVIVSLEHVIKINKCRLWGPWELDWVVDLDDITSMPKMNCIELILNLRQSDTNTGRLQQIKISGQKELLLWLHEKIEQAIIVSMEDKSWAVSAVTANN